MATIGIDAHAIGERLTGNETYISNLIEQIDRLDSGHNFVLFYTNREAASRSRLKLPQMSPALMRPANPLVRLPLVMPWLARRWQLDLLHVQYAGPPIVGVPLVVMIHDISYEHHPEYFTKRQVMQFKATIPPTARKAARILTVSEFSKSDIAEAYGIPKEKIVVTHDGVSSKFAPVNDRQALASAATKYGIGGEYILTVGNLQPRKNLIRLLEAYTRLRNARSDIAHKLVIVGKRAWKFSPILSSFKHSRWANDIIFTGYMPHGDLPAIYSGASAFVYVSLFEGFGLPPLEAMACGTPVVVSNRTSLPEVAGGSGVLVNPLDADEIAAAIASLLLDPAVNSYFREKGLKRASAFSWAECAAKTLAVYDQVLKEE